MPGILRRRWQLPLSAATILATSAALLVAGLVPADAQQAPASERQPAGDLLAVPGGNTFPVPAPHEVAFSDSWHACRDGCSRQHKGNDLMTAEGTPVVAVESGEIAKVDNTDDGNGGLSVWLRGDSGVAYYYAHNSANVVTVGQRVARGQQIARVGHTGNARTTPPHIHFQINRCGELSSAEPCTVDPYEPLRSWPQELVDGGADALGLYTPSDAKLRRRAEGGSALPLIAYGSSGASRSSGSSGSAPAGARAEARAEDVPVAGDWNGDGRDTVGIYRPSDATFHLRDEAGARLPAFRYGAVGDLPLAGDWDGDGRDSVGVYRPSEATFFLRDDEGRTLPAFRFGTPAATAAAAVLPVAGDWEGDRRDTVALFRVSDATFVARDDSGAALPPVRYGRFGDLPLTGDWDGDGRDTLGVYRAVDGSFRLQGFTDLPPGPPAPAESAGPAEDGATAEDSDEARDEADVAPVTVPVPSGPVVFGPRLAPGARPVAGDWNGRELVTLDDLRGIWGSAAGDATVAQNLPLLNLAMVQSGVVTPARKAAFLATILNESRFRFDAVERGTSRYRGRGFIQLTSEGNYARAGAHLGLDLTGDPELVTNPFVSTAVTSWYWTVARNINLAADRLDMAAVNIAVGYRPSVREDFERCADFMRALSWFNGGTLPEGVNCERSFGALANALATFPSQPAADPGAGAPASVTPPPTLPPVPVTAPVFSLPPPPTPGPVTEPTRPTPPGGPPRPAPGQPTTTPPTTPPTTEPPTTAPPTTAPPTTTVPDSSTTTEPPPPTTTSPEPLPTTEPPAPTTTSPEPLPTTEPPAPTTTSPDTPSTEAPTTTEAPPPGG